MTDQTYIPQAKLLKVVQLIEIMKRSGITINQIALTFEMNPRTAYRYLDIIEAAGYIVEKDFMNRFYIHKSRPYNRFLNLPPMPESRKTPHFKL